MFAIARSELLQIFRNRLVLVTMLIIPVASSAFYIYLHRAFPKLGEVLGVGPIAAHLGRRRRGRRDPALPLGTARLRPASGRPFPEEHRAPRSTDGKH